MIALNDDMCACITSIRLQIGTEIDCRKAASIISRTPGITELSVYYVPGWDLVHRSYAESCRDFVCMLFHPDDTTFQFSRLRRFFLKDFDLGLLPSILSQSVDFSKLEELRLVRCEEAGNMLVSLSLQQVNWKLLCIEEELIGNDNGQLRSFLRTMNAPKRLSIGRATSYAKEDDTGKICWTDLIPHAATLKSLRLNIDQPSGYLSHDRSGKSVADFRDLCKSASDLSQLALTCPSIEEEKWRGEHGFTAFLVRNPNHPKLLQVVLTS